MSSNLAKTIIGLLRDSVQGRRLNVALYHRGNLLITERVIAEGHRTIIFGDRFAKLYFAYRRLGCAARETQLVLEADFSALPIAQHSLDLLILQGGLPSGSTPVDTLARLRHHLNPGGLLVWPQPISDGFWGRTGRLFDPFRLGIHKTCFRRELCTWTMAAGYAHVTQHHIRGNWFPWVVTTGRAGGHP